mmetsp:Transcript_10133/g.14335  ORF Transcript_10133/g.14335 Transcript_10133/m.14335 type:complete len:346 (+) Transcript_10133:94-1131(+)
MVSAKVSEVRSANWSGMLPIELSLAPTSLSSPTMPAPIHVMVSRQTYFHVGLQDAVMRLYKFAPPVLSFRNMTIRNEPDPGEDSGDDNDVTGLSTADSTTESSNRTDSSPKTITQEYPVCWFEDEETQIALRWHLFVGVLYDLNKKDAHKKIPWKIRLHFSGYPHSQILPLDDSADGVWTTVERTFKNSLKQALFLQYGSSKVAMGMTKQSHERIWDSIVTTNYQLYQQVNSDLQVEPKADDDLHFLPVRLLVDAKPPIQRPCRVCIDAKTDTGNDMALDTLGSLLQYWIPQFFTLDPAGVIKPEPNTIDWSVQGIQIPLTSHLIDLWRCLCHPDHFLYIVVRTQ